MRLSPHQRQRASGLLLVLVALIALYVAVNGDWLTSTQQPYASAARGSAAWTPSFDGPDADRRQLRISLERVATGIAEPTDIQFPPGSEDYAVVLQKSGTARWLKLSNGAHGVLFEVDVVTASEEGLLGLAFHPDFAHNGRFFVNYVTRVGGQDTTRIEAWRMSGMPELMRAKAIAIGSVLEVAQPYANHNAGQLAFGPDGKLYVGFGDGGSQGDPHGNGQNPAVLLGKMLRLDVDAASAGRAYGVPADNPFVGDRRFRPEVFAWGLRNPWRYSFDPAGRLVVADLGANSWEELDLVSAGDNLGWNAKEGFACTSGAEHCGGAELVDPIYAYGRRDGYSITGGYVYTGTRIEQLRGLYVFGDFGSGRLFALELPRARQRVADVIALGRWPMLPSTFGRDAHGELYVASFVDGEIYRFR